MNGIGVLEFEATLWRYSGGDGWYFVSVPEEISDDIRQLTEGVRRGFGSVRVAVTVGGTSWRTSIFPDSRSGTFMLPLKRTVRVAERIEAGDDVRLKVELVDL